MGNTRQELVTRTKDLIERAKIMGLKVNQDKTQYLVMTRKIKNNSDLVVENYISTSKIFKYLGVNINQKIICIIKLN